jgi:hypothetical protein
VQHEHGTGDAAAAGDDPGVASRGTQADHSLRRPLEGALDVPFTTGNTVDVLRNGDEIFSAMLDVIARSTSSIDLLWSLWGHGEITDLFTGALAGRSKVSTRPASKWPKAVEKITEDLDTLLAFYDYPAEHWIHLRTTNPIESTFATVRLRQRVTKGPGSRSAGVAMAFKLIESAQARRRAVNAPHHVALVRAGATFINGKLVERPDESGADQQVA